MYVCSNRLLKFDIFSVCDVWWVLYHALFCCSSTAIFCIVNGVCCTVIKRDNPGCIPCPCPWGIITHQVNYINKFLFDFFNMVLKLTRYVCWKVEFGSEKWAYELSYRLQFCKNLSSSWLGFFFGIREADTDRKNEPDGQTIRNRGNSPKSPTLVVKPQIWAILDGFWFILASSYLLYVSLFLWLNAVISSFFYFQVRPSTVMSSELV